MNCNEPIHISLFVIVFQIHRIEMASWWGCCLKIISNKRLISNLLWILYFKIEQQKAFRAAVSKSEFCFCETI